MGKWNNNISSKDIDDLAKEIAEEEGNKDLSDGEKLILAIILHDKINAPLNYETIGKIIGAMEGGSAISKVGVSKIEDRAMKKVSRWVKRQGFTHDDIFESDEDEITEGDDPNELLSPNDDELLPEA